MNDLVWLNQCVISTVCIGVASLERGWGAPLREKVQHTQEKTGKIKGKGEKSEIKGENSQDKKKNKKKQLKSD